MNKTLRNSIIIIGFLLILGLIKIFFLTKPQEQSGKDVKKGDKPQLVTIYEVKSETLENNITSAGSINSDMEAQLKAEVSGRVIKILFTEGKSVRKGQLLVKLNDADLQAQLKKIKIQLKLAIDKEQRSKKLLEINGISQEEYENQLTQLETIKADMEYTEAMIEKTEIRAPFDGTIGLRNIDEGQYISPSVIIASIQKTNPIKIEFSVPEQYASMIVLNSEITFTIKGNNKKHTAKIYAIEPKINPNTRSLMIRAKCSNTNGEIFPGSFADVEISLKKIEHAILIPSEALVPILKGQKVYLYKAGVAVERKVKIGIRTSTQIQIIEGINSGDTIITSGIMQIKDGSKVNIKSKK